MGNKNNESILLEILSQIKSDADSAQYKFNERKWDIERNSNNPIDLFGGSAVSSVSAIAMETRIACDDLYASLQTYVRLIDEKCRPLVDDSVSSTTLKKIVDLIDELNESSSISINFTASLNYHGLGDVADIEYFPTVESKMIQTYWDNTYNSHPDTKKEKERERIAEEKRKAELEEIAHNDKQKYDVELNKWEDLRDTMLKKRSQFIDEKISAKKSELLKKYEKTFEEQKIQLMNDLTEFESKLENEKNLLESLGVLAVFKKRKSRKQVLLFETKIAEIKTSLEKAELTYKNNNKTVDSKAKRSLSKFENEAKSKYPIPRKPRMPESVARKELSPTAMVNWYLKNEILDYIIKVKKPVCTNDVFQNCMAVSPFTLAKIKGWLDSLVNDGELSSYKKEEVVYYQLTQE